MFRMISKEELKYTPEKGSVYIPVYKNLENFDFSDIEAENIKTIPIFENKMLYFSPFPFYISNKEIDNLFEFLRDSENFIFLRFGENWVFDPNHMAKKLIHFRLLKNNKILNFVSDNPILKMVLKSLVNLKVNPKKAIIVDLHNFFHVRFHISKEEKKINYKGIKEINVGLIRQFREFLHYLLYRSDYDMIFFVTESPKNWRKSFKTKIEFSRLYDEKHDFSYKDKKETEEDLLIQMEICENLVQKLGFPLIKKEEFEADDVIASLAKAFTNVFGDAEIHIYSSDKDMFQLADSRIKIYHPKEKKILTREDIINKLGVPPEKVVEYLSLVGDSSDNIPGVKGIGPKKARILIDFLMKENKSMLEFVSDPSIEKLLNDELKKIKKILEEKLKVTSIFIILATNLFAQKFI